MAKTKEEIIELNKRQSNYYHLQKEKKKHQSFATKLWWKLREKSLSSYLKKYGISEYLLNEQKGWFGDVANKSVLDFGCGSGNPHSLYLAKSAKQYLALDLSQSSINNLISKLEKEGIYDGDHINAIAIDILAESQFLTKFDVIYAAGVLHHFSNIEIILERLDGLLNPGGVVVSYDPTNTRWYIRLVRWIYRPFQTDAEWEFPFGFRQFALIEKYFLVERRCGILNKSIFGFLLQLIPMMKTWKENRILSWIKDDLNISKAGGQEVYRCLHVALLLRKKNENSY
jgi:2-polyprenyl-3-methyl-5-hydroxy-6-metoxy-1,4-benzoquinol methylase